MRATTASGVPDPTPRARRPSSPSSAPEAHEWPRERSLPWILLQVLRIVEWIPAGGGVHEDHEGLGALLLEAMRHALRDADEVARADLSPLVPQTRRCLPANHVDDVIFQVVGMQPDLLHLPGQDANVADLGCWRELHRFVS